MKLSTILSILLSGALTYLVFAFIINEYNSQLWSWDARYWLVSFIFIEIIGISMFNYLSKSHK